MDEDPVAWGKRMRRKSALRVLIGGSVILAVGGWYYWDNRDWGLSKIGDTTIVHRGAVDPRLIGGAAIAIGAILVLVSIVMLARVNRTPRPHDD